MHIHHGKCRFETEQPFISFNRFNIKFKGFKIFQITNMLAHDNLIFLPNCKTVNQFGTGSKYAFCIQIDLNG